MFYRMERIMRMQWLKSERSQYGTSKASGYTKEQIDESCIKVTERKEQERRSKELTKQLEGRPKRKEE